MGAKKYKKPSVTSYGPSTSAIYSDGPSTSGQATHQSNSHQSSQTLDWASFEDLQVLQEEHKQIANFPLSKKICNEGFKAPQEEFPYENLQTIGVFSHKNIQPIQKKFLTTFQAIQENISSEMTALEQSQENYQEEEKESSDESDQTVIQSMQEKSFHENDQTIREKSVSDEVQIEDEASSHENVQPIQKKSLTTFQAIQEDISDEMTALEQSQENYQEEEKAFSDAVEKFFQENDHDEQKKSSRDNVQTTGEGSSCRNDQSVEEIQSSHEIGQTAQENPFHRDVEDAEDRPSNTNDQGEFFQKNGGRYTWLKKISIEPTMWLYMMAFMFTSVVEQAFFVYKACRVDHGHSDEICSHLNDHKDIKTEVQKTVSEFQQWYNISGHIVPIILALLFGNWSDRRGRKLPLIIGLAGKLFYSLMIVVNSLMENWNLNMVTYTAVIPMGMLGGDVIIFGSCFAYLTDICSLAERTMRITILDVVYLSTMPTGIALGSYVFSKVNSSYAIMFTINACLLVLAIIYSFVRLQWQSSPEQRSLVGVNLLKDFFDIEHIKETVNTLIKPRPDSKRMCLILVMLSMCLYTFQRDEKPMSFLYTQLVFNWDVSKFSNFRTFQSSFFVAAMLGATPMMKYLKLKDTAITIIGAISHATGRLLFIIAHTGQVFYGGAVVAALGPVVAPALRSMASKFVSVEERGKVFAILSVFDNAVPLISSVLYSQVYNATINTMPYFIYWLTFITQICVILLAIVINFIS